MDYNNQNNNETYSALQPDRGETQTSQGYEPAQGQQVYAKPQPAETPKKKSGGKFWVGLVVGLAIMSVVLLLTVGLVVYYYNNNAPVSSANTESHVSGSGEVLDTTTLSKLEAILKVFDAKSILELDTEELQRGLIDGLIEASGDKYAQYYSAEEIVELMGDYEGTFYGIGATLSLNEEGYPEVQSVYKDSPAEKAGIRAGDIITQVFGEDVYGLTLDEIVDEIRGEKGTEVDITVYRSGESDYLYLTAVRDEISVEVVEYEMLEDNLGYIHIEEWYETTPDQFKAAREDLESQGMEGLIVDLRSNTGGLLDSVCAVCDQLLPEGLIVYTEDVNGQGEKFMSSGKTEIDIPVVILTNVYTASASEIFTAAMKDHGKAISLGTTTYGKGVVQSFQYFSDGSAMKLTTEQYFTPNGTAIDGVGIEPDIEVKFDSEAYYDEEDPHDNQLEAAQEYLLGELGK